MKKKTHYILSFIIPLLLVAVIFAINKIAPFGSHPIRIYDSYYQYTGFILNLKEFSFYSLKAGLGFNFFATATYYLLSPFNLLFLFSNAKNIDIFYTIIVLLKISSASTTMTILLNYKNHNKASLLFGIIYSLSGFIITYYYNTMWLDGIILLPLVILGLKKLINERKPLLYLITLTITIITNFYIAYMVAIMTLIFFIYLLINSDKKDYKYAIINFIIYSLLAGLISSFVILPAFYGLLMGKASGYLRHDYTKYYELNDNIKYFLYKLCPGTYNRGDQDNYGPMLIYSTLYVFVLFILNFFNSKKSDRYKISTLIILMIFFLSFAFNLFDYAWQFFQRPVWWNHRYAFAFSFFLIYVGYESYLNKKDILIKKSYYYIISITTIILFLVSFIIKINNLSSKSEILITIIIGIISISLLINYFIFFNKPKFRYYILALVIIELVINTSLTIKNNVFERNLNTINKNVTAIKNTIDSIEDKNNYRMELLTPQASNDGLVYDYNGINYFNSLRNQNYINFAEYILEFDVNSHCSTKMNYYDPLLLELLNIKYLIGDINYYPIIKTIDGKIIHQTYFDSSFGYSVSNKINDLKLNKNDPKETKLTKIVNTMIDKDYNYYQSLDYEKTSTLLNNIKISNNTLTITNKTDYAYATFKFISNKEQLIIFNSQYKGNIKLSVNGIAINQYNYNYYPLHKNDEVLIEVKHNPAYDLKLFKIILLDLNNANKAINELSNNRLHLNQSNHLISGNINISKNKTLFLSLPYEEGFIIKVDGKKTPYHKVLDAFVGVDLKAGNHNITIDYISKGFNPGIIMSISGLGLSIISLSINKCYNKKEG